MEMGDFLPRYFNKEMLNSPKDYNNNKPRLKKFGCKLNTNKKKEMKNWNDNKRKIWNMKTKLNKISNYWKIDSIKRKKKNKKL